MNIMKNVVIVGAGTGGLSVARELSKNQDVNIKIIEKGPVSNPEDAINIMIFGIKTRWN